MGITVESIKFPLIHFITNFKLLCMQHDQLDRTPKTLGQEVLDNLNSLMSVINKITDPELEKIVDHWKHQKGVPNLVRALVKADDLLTHGIPSAQKQSKVTQTDLKGCEKMSI